MQEKRDYLIREVAGKRVIAPVDYTSTGVIQEHTHWSNGLHQYLQIQDIKGQHYPPTKEEISIFLKQNKY